MFRLLAEKTSPSPVLRSAGLATRLLSSEDVKGYLFIAPWLIGFLAFGLWPLLRTFYNSFTAYDLFNEPVWVGFKNYERIFLHDAIFARVSLNMLLYVLLSTVITIGGGLLLALLLNRRFPGNHLFRTLIYIPSLLVGVAIGLMFKQIFASGDIGLANEFLGIFHIKPVDWLSDYNQPFVGLITLILINLWFTGSAMLIFLAGLKGIPGTYYEAARIDGANGWNLLRHITLPLLAPVIVYNTIMTLIGHIQVFETPLTFATNGSLTSGSLLGYQDSIGVFMTYIFQKAFIENDFGYGSALSVIVFLITLVLTLLVL